MIDDDYELKFEKFKEIIEEHLKNKSFYKDIDYEITDLHCSTFDLYKIKETTQWYKSPITTLGNIHPQYENIGIPLSSGKLFKYSEQHLYENSSSGQEKTIEGLNLGTLKIKHLYTDIFPYLTEKTI